MSGILGFYNFENSLLEESKDKIKYRGVNFFEKTQDNFQAGFLGDENPFEKQNKSILVCENSITNWKELSEKYDLEVENKEDFLYEFLSKFQIEKVDELEGGYAFGFYIENKIYIFRDVVGVKPLCYFYENEKFAFSSESKVLPKGALELNPREYGVFDCQSSSFEILERKRYYSGKTLAEESFDTVKKKTKNLIIKAILKKVKKGDKIGILFSGGTDSTLMALILEELGIEFKCYTASIKAGNFLEGEDIVFGRKVAQERKFNWELVEVSLDEVPEVTKEIMRVIEDTKYTKVSVALPLFTGLKGARDDGVKFMFSGIGSEEVYADYKRDLELENINETCIEGLKSLWIRDLYRDDTLAKSQGIELVYPFLDDELVDYCIRMNPDYKINKKTKVNKIILRELIRNFGLSDYLVDRKKKAAQYGCKSDRVYEKLSKQKKMLKQEYLEFLKDES